MIHAAGEQLTEVADVPSTDPSTLPGPLPVKSFMLMPSKRWLFCCGRLPPKAISVPHPPSSWLLLPVVIATWESTVLAPGSSAASSVQSRPSSGRSRILCSLTTFVEVGR